METGDVVYLILFTHLAGPVHSRSHTKVGSINGPSRHGPPHCFLSLPSAFLSWVTIRRR